MGISKKIKTYLREKFGQRLISYPDFPMFAPNSTGPVKAKTDLMLQGIRTTIPLLNQISNNSESNQQIIAFGDFNNELSNDQNIDDLKKLLDHYGSDKARKHKYHVFLARMLADRDSIKSILEVGLGTNNTDVVSTMKKRGIPGASVRAFRDFLPNAQIYGADIDKRILFSEERIQTFFVDQTSQASLKELGQKIPGKFDLIIDDGLHAAHANLATMLFALPRLRKGGWFVVEDISQAATPVWELAAKLLPDQYQSTIIQAYTASRVFAVQRIS